MSEIALNWLNKTNQISAKQLDEQLSGKAALQAVERILKYGRNEKGHKLLRYPWFEQQIRLTADNRLRSVLTTGASQVSKSVVNYLVAIDELLNLEINIGWFYASRASLINQQPEQFQKLINNWIENLDTKPKVYRDSVFRYSVDLSTANFSYANSGSQESKGGAAEGRETASFQASKLYVDEQSSCDSTFDPSPRLGASVLLSKPQRFLGTPGSGAGIELKIKECYHNFIPGVICTNCNQVAFLEPKGALLKPKIDPKSGKEIYFNSRGEILDYWTRGDENDAFIACIHCNEEITIDEIKNAQLYSKATLQSADEFLDSLPDGEIYPTPVSIYLSPLLRLPTDPHRIVELIKSGLNPENPSIYQQNKLGYASETGVTGVSIKEIEDLLDLRPHRFKPDFRVAGIDQGRDTHWIVILEASLRNPSEINVLLAEDIGQDDLISTLKHFDIDFALIDNEPERLAAYELTKQYPKLYLADQKQHEDIYRIDKVSHGKIEVECYTINNNLFIEQVIKRYTEQHYRFNCRTHRKLIKHITSVRRDLETGNFIRPKDHDDDIFFADVFAEAAMRIYQATKKRGISSVVGKPLRKLGAR